MKSATPMAFNIQNGGQRLPLLFTTHSYRHLEGPFLAEIAGQNLVQKRPVGGTKCEKQTNNVNNGGVPFLPRFLSHYVFSGIK